MFRMSCISLWWIMPCLDVGWKGGEDMENGRDL